MLSNWERVDSKGKSAADVCSPHFARARLARQTQVVTKCWWPFEGQSVTGHRRAELVYDHKTMLIHFLTIPKLPEVHPSIKNQTAREESSRRSDPPSKQHQRPAMPRGVLPGHGV